MVVLLLNARLAYRAVLRPRRLSKVTRTAEIPRVKQRKVIRVCEHA